MIRVYQSKTGGAKADCLAACVASILEMPGNSVSNFVRNSQTIEEQLQKLKTWAHDQEPKITVTWGKTRAPATGYVIFAASRVDGSVYGHAVVAKDGKPVHDPSGDDRYDLAFDYWIKLEPLPRQ